MYSFQTRLRYSEFDSNLKLPIISYSNLFQDTSVFHSESIGKGLDYLRKRNRVWILASWQIDFYKEPNIFDNVIVSTWPYKFDTLTGYRNFTLTDTSNNVYAAANSIWTLVDTTKMRPTRITDEDTLGYDLSKAYDMEYLPRKICYDIEEFSDCPQLKVLKEHLDNNNHVNNGQYLAIASEYIPESFSYNRVRAEYKKQALLHDIICPKVKITDDTCTVLLCDTSGKIYTVVSFEKR